MPFSFLLTEFIRSKYFDSAANQFLITLFKFYKYIYQLVTSTSKMVTTKDDITFKEIAFANGEKQNTIEIDGGNVIVVGSSGAHERGSSKIKLKNIVDYKWEVKNYVGRLIAVHIDGKYVAYAIKVGGKDGKIEGMVRVVSPVNGQRALIRGKSSEVLDLQFAHIKSQIVLASIENAVLHIHKIETVADNILCTLLLKIEDPIPNHVPKYDKINWCPYVPDNETDTDDSAGKLLVWTRGASFQCYNINNVVDAYGIGTHKASDLTEGSLKFEEETPITGAVLSPDGTTLAITFEDGEIRFYQVYFHINEDEPRLLHQWMPHDGKPVSGLFFLDDHSKCGAGNSLWKFAITASDNNTEFKLWCCATWECIQTIRFQGLNGKAQFFQAEIDPTSSYLVVTETGSRTLYIMQIIQTGDEDTKSEGSKTDDQSVASANGIKPSAFIKSIAEFPLSTPILSFGIVDAMVRKYRCASNDVYLLEELDDFDEDGTNRYCVVIHLFLVQPKSVQECHVLYQPTVAIHTDCGTSVSALSDHTNHDEELSKELSVTLKLKSTNEDSLTNPISSTKGAGVSIKGLLETSTSSSSGSKSENEKTSSKPPSALNLLTPDSFHSSGKLTPEGVSNEVYSALRMLAGEKPIDGTNLLHLVNNNLASDDEKTPLLKPISDDSNIENNDDPDIVPPMPPVSMLSTTVASGGSSPSREVQEILSQKDSDCLGDEHGLYGDIFPDESDGSANGNGDIDADADAVDANDEEKNSNQDDDETYVLNNVNDALQETGNGIVKTSKGDWPDAPIVIPLQNADSLYKKSVSSSPINDINLKLDQLLEVIQSQNCQIAELRNEVVDLKKSHSGIGKASASGSTQKVEVNSQNMEIRVTKLIEDYLGRYEREHKKRLEAFSSSREVQNREIREFLFGITPVLCNQLSGQISQILVNEVQKHLLPIVGAKLDAIKAQLQTDIAQKLTITDHVIKENIANICKSKDTLDVFGGAVANGVRSGLQHTYVETLKSLILPAYEKANAELFKQLYDTFNKGTIAYTNQLSGYTKMYEPIHSELTNLLRSVPEQLRQMNDATVTLCTQRVSGDINKDLKIMQSNLLKTLKENIKMEIKKGFEAQAASLEDSVIMAVRSQAQTPAPSVYDVQEQIKLLLQQGQINKAFHQALLANDLHLVEYALERADYNLVFNPCPLEQTVLLSLIQQISADMSNHSELKQKYLSDAIINMNMRDPITKEHAPKVLKELLGNCQNYVQNNPHNSLSSGVRMLIMAVQGFGISLI